MRMLDGKEIEGMSEEYTRRHRRPPDHYPNVIQSRERRVSGSIKGVGLE